MNTTDRPARGARVPTVVRQASVVAAAVAQAALPALILPKIRRDLVPPNVIQPAPYTFVVWLPIYAASLAYAVRQARPSTGPHSDPASAAWPLTAAFASSAVWAVLLPRRRYWSAQATLVALAGLAETARQRVAQADASGQLTRADRLTLVPTTGMLAGWGAAAAAVNLASMLAYRRSDRPRTALALTTLTAISAVGAAATRASSGTSVTTTRTYAATVLWALAGIVIGQRQASPLTAAAAAVAAVPVKAAAVIATGIRAEPSPRPSRRPLTEPGS